MSLERCSTSRCRCSTDHQCMQCNRPYCLAHLFPIILAPGRPITLCTACFQEHDGWAMKTLKALKSWQDQEKGIPLAKVLDVYPEASPW